MDKTLTVIFCIPGTTFSHKFLCSWTATLQWCMNNGINVILSQSTGANIYEVRNKILGGVIKLGSNQKPFQGKIKYNYLMCLDSDQTWSYKDFQKILNTMETNTDIPILTGVYCRVTDQETDYTTIMKLVDSDRLSKAYRLMSYQELSELPELCKVDAAGLGFCMFRYGVIEQLEFPWYRPYPIIDVKLAKYVQAASEDISLFLYLKEVGIDLWCDTTLKVKHEKMKEFIGGENE